jgi:DNA-binding HxlR family transcriptional regulator
MVQRSADANVAAFTDADLATADTSQIRLCPAIAFDRIVGGRYKLRVLWILNRGTHRYGEIGRTLFRGTLGKPITPRILSRELKELEQRGLISRHAYRVVPPKVEYSLTDRGRAMMPIIREIVRWGLTRAHEEILHEDIAAFDAKQAKANENRPG